MARVALLIFCGSDKRYVFRELSRLLKASVLHLDAIVDGEWSPLLMDKFEARRRLLLRQSLVLGLSGLGGGLFSNVGKLRVGEESSENVRTFLEIMESAEGEVLEVVLALWKGSADPCCIDVSPDPFVGVELR